MHELGVVFHIAKSVEDIAKENNVTKVKRVAVEIGDVTTIVKDYFIDCWNWNANRSDILRGCELEYISIPAITYCERCGNKYDTISHGKICPKCGSDKTYLIQGNETIIKEIEVYDNSEGDSKEEPKTE